MSVVPRATYRVQLREEFAFSDATAIVQYLAALGISHLYCSPYMQAARGSAHGYDVVDPTRVSDDLGGDEGLQRLSDALRDAGMAQLLDIVPNHMCVTDPQNRYWWDVLLRGRESEHARMFDIDWDAPETAGRLVLPVLGDELDAVLDRGELTVVRRDAHAEIAYFEQRFPLREGSYPDDGVLTRDVLDAQHYSLEYWRTGLARVNYRRFFDVSSLAGVRQEDDAVFALTHQRVLQLVREGVVAGLRIDHVDGLRDPEHYLRRLRDAAPDAWIVVEKILATGEPLPESWPVDGTTGYDFTALVSALQVDAAGRAAVTDCYRAFVEDGTSYQQHARAARRFVLHELLQSEVERLSRAAVACGIDDPEAALVELLASMPVYRVYPSDTALSGQDQDALAHAVRLAGEEGRAGRAVIEQIAGVIGGGDDDDARADLRARFQQVSSAAMAKGVEDTAFYRYVPLVALNEVGAEPEHAVSLQQFHDACIERASTRPHTLLATATHDTKRGEDARVRVAMLSAMPERWCEAVRRLRVRAGAHRGPIGPSFVAEYLLYETLVAAWPLTPDRASQYMLKAVREAKLETSWLSPNEAYEAQLDTFVRGVLDDAVMIEEIEALLEAMTPAWQVASLSQTLLKLTTPGVPDIYQGCELWDLRLVDPDNRTPVDYDVRREMLRRLETASVEEVMADMDAGLPKLYLTHAALQLRRRRPEAFGEHGDYRPLGVEGPGAQHVVAFARGGAVVSVAVRAPQPVWNEWGDTCVLLPEGSWRNVLTGDRQRGGRQHVSALTARFPVVLLEREDG